jgi:hypothetical protein
MLQECRAEPQNLLGVMWKEARHASLAWSIFTVAAENRTLDAPCDS